MIFFYFFQEIDTQKNPRYVNVVFRDAMGVWKSVTERYNVTITIICIQKLVSITKWKHLYNLFLSIS